MVHTNGYGVLMTADWHLGDMTWKKDRSDEYAASLDRVVSAAKESEVGLVLLAGDMFDTARYPGGDAIRLAAEATGRILGLPQNPTVVLLRGNHDWRDIGIWRDLSRTERLFIVEEPQILDIGANLRLFLLPHVRQHQIPRDTDLGTWCLDAWGAAATENWPGRGLFVAHQALEGTVPNLREPVVPHFLVRTLAERCDGLTAYFGHIHRHEPIQSDVPCRYIGSLVKGGFGEAEGQTTGFWIWDARTGRDVSCPLPSRTLVTLRFEDAEDLTARFVSEWNENVSSDAWVRIVVENPASEAILEDVVLSMLSKEDSERVAVVTSSGRDARDVLTETPEEDAYELTVEELWQDYVASRGESESVLRAGLDLLAGKSPEEVFDALLAEPEYPAMMEFNRVR